MKNKVQNHLKHIWKKVILSLNSFTLITVNKQVNFRARDQESNLNKDVQSIRLFFFLAEILNVVDPLYALNSKSLFSIFIYSKLWDKWGCEHIKRYIFLTEMNRIRLSK